MNKAYGIGLCIGLIWVSSAGAQTCRTDIAATAPDSRYQDNRDGTVTDTQTGLVWDRCSWGQSWTGSSCSGSASSHNWSAALQQADSANNARHLGYQDWRVPNVKELTSLVEERCIEPAINTNIFPDTPASWFWSSSPYANYSDYAWYVNFFYGNVYSNSKNDDRAVRLVRAGQASVFLPDNQPDVFSFTASSNTALSSTITSGPITVQGINTAASIGVQNGEYRINSGSWTSGAGTVNNGDNVTVRHTSSASYSQTVTTTLTIGGVSGVFRSTTETKTEVIGEGFVEGNVYDACNGKLLEYVDLWFSNGRQQQTNEQGQFRVKMPSGNVTLDVAPEGYDGDSRAIAVSANQTRYLAFALAPPQGCGLQGAASFKAVIVAGTGPYLGEQLNHIWSRTRELADKAYIALKKQGFGDQHIYYLTADPKELSHDADGDGQNDIDGLASAERLQQVLTQEAGGVEDVVVYLIGHGGVNVFHIDRFGKVSGNELKAWLDGLQTQIFGRMTTVIDACYSGSFLSSLAARNRYILASARYDQQAIIGNKEGTTSFSYYFWDEVVFSSRLGDAFRKARQAMSREQIGGGQTQIATLDTDNSGSETANDYDAIGQYCFGECRSRAASAPVIESVEMPESLNGTLSAGFSLQVSSSNPLQRGWVTVQRPDYAQYVLPSSGVLAVQPEVELSCQGSVCQGVYDNFNLNDDYTLTFRVQDNQGQVSEPRSVEITQTGRNANERTAASVYEAANGLLTLKDVNVGGQHYYVELQDLGEYQFGLKMAQPLSGVVLGQPANFDGVFVNIPNLLAFEQYFSVVLDRQSDGLFRIQSVAAPQ